MPSFKRFLALAPFVMPLALGAQQLASNLTVHGYLTQGYGISGGIPVLGLTRDGTADYRRAAILVRYAATASDHFVLQVAHRRLGDSPTMQFEDNVKLDVAFYEHRFPAGTSVRVGKLALPWGIYNEVRYAGTLTPFYRAPFSVYRDGTYTSETVDGASVSQVLRGGEPWEVSLDAYGGSFEQLEFGPTFAPGVASTYAGAILKSKNVLGGQVWLATPLTGLRVGVSGRRQKDIGGIYERPDGGNTKQWIASVDGQFDRWLLRAEHQHQSAFGFESVSRYAQAGYHVLPWLAVNAQSEMRDEQLRYTPTSAWISQRAIRDDGLGVSFYVAPNSVLKFEGHKARGFGALYEMIVDSNAPALKSNFFISSFSVSF